MFIKTTTYPSGNIIVQSSMCKVTYFRHVLHSYTNLRSHIYNICKSLLLKWRNNGPKQYMQSQIYQTCCSSSLIKKPKHIHARTIQYMHLCITLIQGNTCNSTYIQYTQIFTTMIQNSIYHQTCSSSSRKWQKHFHVRTYTITGLLYYFDPK